MTMPPAFPPSSILSPAILREELGRLLPVAQLRHRVPKSESQKKSELAVLLHEAQRTEAFRAWGSTTLGGFVSAAGMGPNVFNKYKAAGEHLLNRQPDLYAAVLSAVAANTPRPALPDVSRLRLRRIIEKRMVAHGRTMLDELLNERRAPLRVVDDLAKRQSFGEADKQERRVLSELDDLLIRADQVAELVQRLHVGSDDGPSERVTTRLAVLKQRCLRLLELANTIVPPTRSQ